MRKKDLIHLLQPYNNIKATLLRTILQEEPFRSMPDEENISFDILMLILQKNGLEPILPAHITRGDENLFKLFLGEPPTISEKMEVIKEKLQTIQSQLEEKYCDAITLEVIKDPVLITSIDPATHKQYVKTYCREGIAEWLRTNNCDPITKHPVLELHHIRTNKNILCTDITMAIEIKKLQDEKLRLKSELFFLNQSQSHFSGPEEKKDHITPTAQWKTKLLELNCSPAIVEVILAGRVILNFSNLCDALSSFTSAERRELTLWQLCCLSGEPRAIEYAIKHKDLTASTKTLTGVNALHYAAKGGVIEAIQYVLQVLEIPASSLDNNGNCLFHFIRSQKAMQFALEVLELNPAHINANGENVLHAASCNASIPTIKYLRRTSHFKHWGLDPYAVDIFGHNAFWYAQFSAYGAEARQALLIDINQLLTVKVHTRKNRDCMPSFFPSFPCFKDVIPANQQTSHHAVPAPTIHGKRD